MMNTKRGEFQAVNIRQARKRCLSLASVAFVLGLIAGAAGALQAATPTISSAIPAVLFGVGQYLCREWNGLMSITRVEPGFYRFQCRELAEFPRVEVHVDAAP